MDKLELYVEADVGTPTGERKAALKALLMGRVEDKCRLFEAFKEAERREMQSVNTIAARQEAPVGGTDAEIEDRKIV